MEGRRRTTTNAQLAPSSLQWRHPSFLGHCSLSSSSSASPKFPQSRGCKISLGGWEGGRGQTLPQNQNLACCQTNFFSIQMLPPIKINISPPLFPKLLYHHRCKHTFRGSEKLVDSKDELIDTIPRQLIC